MAPAPTVKPLLAQHCISCHGSKDPKGQFQLHDLVSYSFRAADVHRWQRVLEMVETGEMPPADRPELEADDREAFQATLNSLLEQHRAGRSAWERELPRYANRLDHDALFSGKHQGPAYTPARYWRKQAKTI